MDEYITKKQVIEWFRCYAHEDIPIIFEDLEFDIQHMIPEDVTQVRHGRWLSWDELHGGNTPAKNVLGVFCSECIRQSDSKTDFCQNCGAKMDLEEPNDAE